MATRHSNLGTVLTDLGDLSGTTTTPVTNPTSWINLSPHEADEFGVPRAYVHITLAPSDPQTWQAMDRAALDLAQAPTDLQYLYDQGWQSQPFPLNRPFPPSGTEAWKRPTTNPGPSGWETIQPPR